jgi:uncharacterized protein (TIGR03437 family)
MNINLQLCRFATIVVLAASQLSAAAVSRVIYATNISSPSVVSNPHVATDRSGNTLIAAAGPIDHILPPLKSNPSAHTFVTKISADGKETLFRAIVENAIVTALTVDSAGAIYLAGALYSGNQPFDTTAGALQKDAGDGFFMKLSPQGTVIYKSRISADPRAIAVDAAGALYLTGIAKSDFRTTPGAYKPDIGEARCSYKYGTAACTDAFVAKISADGSTLLYGTFLGGTSDDSASAIAVDSAGSTYIVGETTSADFKTTAGAFQPGFSGTVTLGPFTWGDGFAARLDPTGHSLLYASYLGGSGVDFATGVAVDANQNAYIVGTTRSRDFPITLGAFQKTYSGDSSPMPARSGDAFFAKLSPTGQGIFASYLGGPRDDTGGTIALGPGNRVYLTTTGSVLHVLDRRSSTPCDPETTLVAIDRDTGQVIDYSGVRGTYSPVDTAVDSAGIIHVAGRRSEADSRFTSTTGPPVGDLLVSRLDFTKTDIFVPACLVNAATYAPTTLVPNQLASGEIITMFGVGLGPKEGIAAQIEPDGTYPKDIAGTRIRLGDRLLPLLYVSESQVNAIIPLDVAPTPASPLVIERGDFTASYNFEITPVLAGLFTSDASGKGQAAALNQDGSVNSESNPASGASVISLFGTGMGPLTESLPADSPAPLSPPWPAIATHFEAYVAGTAAPNGAFGCEILYAGPAPGLAPGVYQINVRLPGFSATGRVLIQLADNAPPFLRTQRDVYVSVKAQ